MCPVLTASSSNDLQNEKSIYSLKTQNWFCACVDTFGWYLFQLIVCFNPDFNYCSSFFYHELIKLILEHKILDQLLQKVLLCWLHKWYNLQTNLTWLAAFQKFSIDYLSILMELAFVDSQYELEWIRICYVIIWFISAILPWISQCFWIIVAMLY